MEYVCTSVTSGSFITFPVPANIITGLIPHIKYAELSKRGYLLFDVTSQKVQEAGIRVDTYESMKNLAESGLLLKVLRHESGVVPMPYVLPKLSNCNISIIEEWVSNGALND